MNPVVEIESVSKQFGATRAVDDVSFEVHAGEIFGLLGPNGAGKTTTIRMMLDIFEPDSGRVAVFGAKLDDEGKNRIGYLPEERGLYRDQQLETVLIYLATLKGLSSEQARSRLDPWLERFDLSDHRQKKVQELSRGMQQKAQLIATMIHEPDLLVVDEPFSGLDPVNTRLVKEIIDKQRQAGKAVIMSTHQMVQVEALCDRIVLIHRGKTVLNGEVRAIKRSFAGNAVNIAGQGDFHDLPGVMEARQDGDSWHLALKDGVEPQSVFQSLAGRSDLRIERFELAEPTLDDIFISVVGRENGDE